MTESKLVDKAIQVAQTLVSTIIVHVPAHVMNIMDNDVMIKKGIVVSELTCVAFLLIQATPVTNHANRAMIRSIKTS